MIIFYTKINLILIQNKTDLILGACAQRTCTTADVGVIYSSALFGANVTAMCQDLSKDMPAGSIAAL